MRYSKTPHRIYLGNQEGAEWSKEDILRAQLIIGDWFQYATITVGHGVYDRNDLPTLIIFIASDSSLEVLNLAYFLGKSFDQKTVGVEYNNKFEIIPI